MSTLDAAPGLFEAAEPQALGFNPGKLAEAVALAEASEIPWPRELAGSLSSRLHEPPPYNQPLGRTPPRGGPNGVLLRHGRIAAAWGEPTRADLTFSVAKSYLSVLAGIAVGDGLIRDVHDPIRGYALDDGFEAARNRDITWHHMLQQTSEWEGTLFDRPDLLDRNRDVGDGADNSKKGTHRDLQQPGTFWEYNDVRINRLSLSLLQVFKRPLPEVLAERIMRPIGASEDWEWIAYDNATVTIEGKPMASVPGGTHWGCGLCIAALDQARLGQLMLQGGRWQGRQLISEDWLRRTLTPCTLKPVYGYLWWLNTGRAYRPAAPASSYFAIGAGGNSIWVEPSLDLVAVFRWLDPQVVDRVIAGIVESLA
jgi:CubicO group peptidase (beta-lactamase class C family)